MRYKSFQLFISGAPAGYTILASSPAGKETYLVPLLSLQEAEIALEDLWWENSPGRHLAVLDSKRERSSETIFQDLFVALLQESIFKLYRKTFDFVTTDPDIGLRIEITLDSRSPQSAALQMLPWELLRLPGTPNYLAMHRRSPIVRLLAAQQSRQAVVRPRKLRILVVASGGSPLDLNREMRNLHEAMGSVTDLEIVIPEAPTLVATRKALLEAGDCHVLHFMGHGSILAESAKRVVLFESEDGRDESVSGTDLLNTIADFASLQLVVLNACISATGSPVDPMFDPFTSVARTLVLGGIPAVIAMQSPISDSAAITFSRAFYQRLAAGDPVDAAVAEGRQAMYSQHTASLEWASPVLFMEAGRRGIFPQAEASGAQMHEPEINLCGSWTGSWKNLIKEKRGMEKIEVLSQKGGEIEGYFYDVASPAVKMNFAGQFRYKNLFVTYYSEKVLQAGSCSLELQEDGSLMGYYSDFSGCGTYELKLDQSRP
jgi:hypothetical protein